MKGELADIFPLSGNLLFDQDLKACLLDFVYSLMQPR